MTNEFATASISPNSATPRKVYRRPNLRSYGHLRQLTRGNNGSSQDGNYTMTQLGRGNDPNPGPH